MNRQEQALLRGRGNKAMQHVIAAVDGVQIQGQTWMRQDIQPVIDVGDFVGEGFLHVDAVNIAAIGNTVVLNVPPNVLWKVTTWLFRRDSGSWSIGNVQLDIAGSGFEAVETFNPGVAKINMPVQVYGGQPIFLRGGDRVRVSIDTFSSSGNLEVVISGTRFPATFSGA